MFFALLPRAWGRQQWRSQDAEYFFVLSDDLTFWPHPQSSFCCSILSSNGWENWAVWKLGRRCPLFQILPPNYHHIANNFSNQTCHQFIYLHLFNSFYIDDDHHLINFFISLRYSAMTGACFDPGVTPPLVLLAFPRFWETLIAVGPLARPVPDTLACRCRRDWTYRPVTVEDPTPWGSTRAREVPAVPERPAVTWQGRRPWQKFLKCRCHECGSAGKSTRDWRRQHTSDNIFTKKRYRLECVCGLVSEYSCNGMVVNSLLFQVSSFIGGHE